MFEMIRQRLDEIQSEFFSDKLIPEFIASLVDTTTDNRTKLLAIITLIRFLFERIQRYIHKTILTTSSDLLLEQLKKLFTGWNSIKRELTTNELKQTFEVVFGAWKRLYENIEQTQLDTLAASINSITLVLEYIFEIDAIYCVEFAAGGGLAHLQTIIEYITAAFFSLKYNKQNPTSNTYLNPSYDIIVMNKALDSIYVAFSRLTGLTPDFDEEFLSELSIIPRLCVLLASDKRSTNTTRHV
jgi:hypothetical protein